MEYISTAKKGLVKCRRVFGKIENRRSGCNVMDEDWDILLILDGCRFDTFDRVNKLSGTLTSRRSSGSATREFIQNNFVGKQFYDTVYVTANPFVSMDAADAFHDVIHLWRTDWDSSRGTVRPGAVRNALLDANDRYPDKRLVGHFMQPHHPFIGPSAETFSERTAGFEAARNRMLDSDSADGDNPTVWQLLEHGQLNQEEVRRAYEENLEIVLECVEEIIESVEGLIVVTSDHGNLIGEPEYNSRWLFHRQYGHPKYATAEALVKVPWYVQQTGERRNIKSDAPTTPRYEMDETTVEERLSALGYK